jgi:hypothetical protein
MTKKGKATVRKRVKVDLTARRAASTKGGMDVAQKPQPRQAMIFKFHDLLISS